MCDSQNSHPEAKACFSWAVIAVDTPQVVWLLPFPEDGC